MKHDGYTILFVCLGNICRSPTAEGVLRHEAARLAPGLISRIDSAGTADYHIGDPPDPRTRQAATRRGIDLGALRARQVTSEDFRSFDLILAMDRHNLHDLKSIKPSDSSASLELFLTYAADANLLDVPDPYYGDQRAFEHVLDLTTAASRGLIATLQKRA